MGQLIDVPYSVLKENERAYEVMLLRDLYDNTYTDIAREYGISTNRIIQIYHRIKREQLRLYMRHLAIVNGHEDTRFFSRIHYVADKCYLERRYVTAYFEKEYEDILTAYRAGEPGMPEQFIAALPPLIEELSDEIIGRIVYSREVEKKTFSAIGKKFQITPEKANGTYEMYYHKKVMAVSDEIEKRTGLAIWTQYFRFMNSSKKQFDKILREFPELFNDE